MERLTLASGGAAAVDEYLEYRRIVGEDDGGKLFTPDEYEEYKRKVLPTRLQNRLFVSWRSPTGMDCKLVGPETLCFCTHRYKQHKTDFETIPQQRPIALPCRVTGCPCRAYHYVPLNGAQPIRCRCKHFADQHSAASGFACNTCAPSVEALDSPVMSMDHPFLKAFQTSSTSPETLTDVLSRGCNPEMITAGTSTQVSSLRRPEEDDTAFFGRRYQDRIKMEKAAKHKGKAQLPSTTKPS
ncbi:protein FAM221A isoform X9 [Heterocephalus glaber]|uniref:Protein FAM221A n=1 Tax=Heterocephalus glaber TaxID=10181 RepID=A0AAX6SP63_HETGA|nr:protein FAM221A isoform X9 [Heterocephalus glaber]